MPNNKSHEKQSAVINKYNYSKKKIETISYRFNETESIENLYKFTIFPKIDTITTIEELNSQLLSLNTYIKKYLISELDCSFYYGVINPIHLINQSKEQCYSYSIYCVFISNKNNSRNYTHGNDIIDISPIANLSYSDKKSIEIAVNDLIPPYKISNVLFNNDILSKNFRSRQKNIDRPKNTINELSIEEQIKHLRQKSKDEREIAARNSNRRVLH